MTVCVDLFSACGAAVVPRIHLLMLICIPLGNVDDVISLAPFDILQSPLLQTSLFNITKDNPENKHTSK